MKPLLKKLPYPELLIFCAFLAAVALYFNFTAEDAFIVLRYVRNLVGHQELAFNANERINALTSPFHALFIWPFLTLFPLSALALYKFAALVLLMACAYLLSKIYAFKKTIILLCLVILLLSPFVLLWTLGGLETPLLLFTLTLLVFYARNKEAANSNLLKIALLSGVAFIIRFDSVLFTGPLLLIIYVTSFRTLKPKTFVASFFISLLLPVSWLAFTYFYYRDLFPTSFYLKGRTGLSSLVYGDIFYPFQFLMLSGCIPLLFLLLMLYRQKIQFYPLLKRNLHFIPGLLLIGIYFIMNGTVHMMFGYRLIVPYLPVFLKIILDFIPAGPENSKVKALYPAIAVLFFFQCAHLLYVYSFSVQGFNFVEKVEYKKVGIENYEKEFIATLEANALDMQKHILANKKFAKGLRPTFFTFAEGVIPYRMDQIYVYGDLVSYRHQEGATDQADFDRQLRNAADYLHIMHPWPGLGSIEFQLGSDELQNYQVVSDREFYFDGQLRRSVIYYNPAPTSLKLNKYSFAEN
jgi:arabinofuranosyltransferase